MGISPTRFLKSYSKKDFLSKYTLGKSLGSGTFGQIVEATDNFTFRSVAVKYVRRKDVESTLVVEGKKLPSEAVLLNTLEHSNIISLVDLFEFKSKFALVLERPLSSMDVGAFVEKYGPQNDAVGSYIAQQLLTVCDYLNELLIFHRDIKSENILINFYTYHIKIIDFGTAVYADKDQFVGRHGTPAFSPPEWQIGAAYRPEPTTIWSCGVVLFETLTGALPFISEEHVVKANLSFPDLVSRSARHIMRGMMQRKPEDRLTFEQALNHTYITGDLPEENERVMDVSSYSRCNSYTIYENTSCSNNLSRLLE